MFLVSNRQCSLGPRESPTNVKLNFETDCQDERCVDKMATQSEPTSTSILVPSLVRNSSFLYSQKFERINYFCLGLIGKCFQLTMTVLTGTTKMTGP